MSTTFPMSVFYRLIPWAILLLPAILPVQAQTDSTQLAPSVEINYAVPQNYRIADISLTGGEGYDETILLSLSGLNVGDEIDIPGIAISDAVRRFMRSGYFQNATISISKVVGREVWLKIDLLQRPRVSNVEYKGIKQSEKKELEERLGLRSGIQITPNTANRTIQLVTKYFNEKGFSDVAVDVITTDDLSQKNHVNVLVDIRKNSKIKVSEIIFKGNEALSGKQLRKAMKKTNELFSLSKGRAWSSILEIFSSKKFIEKEYREDLNNIISRYHEAGYRDAEIVSDTIYRDEKNEKRIKIEISINEGKKYYISSLRFVGNTKYPSEYLSAVLGIKPGDTYNQKRLDGRLTTDEDAVANIYYNNGYIFAHIDPIETAIKGDSVSLDLRVMEGPQATINKVIIKGNDILYDNVVRRELFTKPGKLFSKDDLLNSYMALNQLDQFDPERSYPTPIPNPQDGTVDIEYNLEPKRSDKFEISLGWSQAGLILRVGLKFTNFSIYNLFHPKMYKGIIPQGDAQTLSIDAMTNGRYYQQYGISFIDPWFGGKKPNYFSTSFFYSRQTALDTRYYNNQIGSLGGYGYGYGGYGYGYGGYGYGGYGDYGGYGGYGNNSLMENAYNPNQSLQVLGASIGFGKRLNKPDNWFQLYLSANYNLYMLNDWIYDTFRGFHNGNANDISFQLRFSRTSIDNPVFTRRGSDFSLSVTATPPYSLFDKKDYSDPRLSSKERFRFIEYHKWRFSGKVFAPLLNPAVVQYTPVLMTRFDMGFIGSYTKYKLSPFGTYYMGGDGMSGVGSYMNEAIGLRGYSNGSIAGNNYDYAYAFLRLSAELRVPILFKGQTNIWALAFLEAGNAWSEIADFNPFSLKRSAGVGVRVTLPMVGLIGVDWGYGFDKPDGSSVRGGSNVHFILGQEF